jgi:hypothetical protein
MPVPLSLLALHFIGDFLLQTDWMALNKSKDFEALGVHVGVYTCVFAGWLYFPVPPAPLAVSISKFLVFTFITHWLTDAVTSRMTARLWFIELWERDKTLVPLTYEAFPFVARVDSAKRHWFFVVIGADQLIHAATLAFAAQRWL